MINKKRVLLLVSLVILFLFINNVFANKKEMTGSASLTFHSTINNRNNEDDLIFNVSEENVKHIQKVFEENFIPS